MLPSSGLHCFLRWCFPCKTFFFFTLLTHADTHVSNRVGGFGRSFEREERREGGEGRRSIMQSSNLLRRSTRLSLFVQVLVGGLTVSGFFLPLDNVHSKRDLNVIFAVESVAQLVELVWYVVATWRGAAGQGTSPCLLSLLVASWSFAFAISKKPPRLLLSL